MQQYLYRLTYIIQQTNNNTKELRAIET